MTSRQPIAVLGATGNQGGHVARALLEAGWPVRAITRHPESPRAKALASYGAEIIQADMGEVDTLIRAFEGVHGVFSVQNFWELGLREEVRLGTNVIEAAQAVGNPHVVYSSGLGAETVQGITAIDGKALLEERLRQSGLPFTILRPGLFMDDFLGASLPFARPVQRLLRHYRPLVGQLFLATLREVVSRGGTIPLTSVADVGRVSAWAWDSIPRSLFQVYPLVGSLEDAELICNQWENITGHRVPRIPALAPGTRIFHPKIAHLLEWLSCQPTEITTYPFHLLSLGDWLLRTHGLT